MQFRDAQPTTSGVVADHVLERRRAFFLLPMRALVNDKHIEFERKYGAFGLKIIRATGEIADALRCGAGRVAAPHLRVTGRAAADPRRLPGVQSSFQLQLGQRAQDLQATPHQKRDKKEVQDVRGAAIRER